MTRHNVYVIIVYMRTYQNFKKQILKDKAVRRAYKELAPEFEFIETLIAKRIERGFTQEALARRVGTKQSAISRLERGAINPSFGFLKKVAHALGSSISVSLT